MTKEDTHPKSQPVRATLILAWSYYYLVAAAALTYTHTQTQTTQRVSHYNDHTLLLRSAQPSRVRVISVEWERRKPVAFYCASILTHTQRWRCARSCWSAMRVRAHKHSLTYSLKWLLCVLFTCENKLTWTVFNVASVTPPGGKHLKHKMYYKFPY